MSRTRLLTWDWKELPDFDDLAEILADLTDGQLHVVMADTQSDQFALVFSTAPITEDEATEVYERGTDG